MRIAISLLNFRPGRIGGTETYLRQVLAHMRPQAGGDHLLLLCTRENAPLADELGLERIRVDRSDLGVVAARMLEAFTPCRAGFAERALAQARCNVALFPQQSLFPKRVRVPCVLVVHALQFLHHPEQFSLFDRAFRSTIYPYSLRRADAVVAISEDMKRTLVDRCGVPAGRITVIRHGMMRLDPDSIHPSARQAGRFLFYPAASYPHKNHLALLSSFAALRQGGYPGKLVLAGERSAYWGVVQREIDRLALGQSVVHLGFLPLAEVLRLYKSAEAVLFPSTYEGLGLPVLEAAAMGKKVVVQRLPIFDELGVPPDCQIDFSDPAQLARALERLGPTVLNSPAWTWTDCAAATLDLLREVGSRSGGATTNPGRA